MIFPIKYTFTQKVDISKLDTSEHVFQVIQRCLLERNEDLRLITNHSTLRFDKSFFFTEKHNVFAPIDYGVFRLDVKKSYLVYEIRFAYLFLFSFCAALLFSLESRGFKGGLFAFLILGVLNWIIAVVRNGKLFNKIVREIHTLCVSSISSSSSLGHTNDRSIQE
jgi:hypothetical protein